MVNDSHDVRMLETRPRKYLRTKPFDTPRIPNTLEHRFLQILNMEILNKINICLATTSSWQSATIFPPISVDFRHFEAIIAAATGVNNSRACLTALRLVDSFGDPYVC